MGINFIMPAVRNERIKRMLNEFAKDAVTNSYVNLLSFTLTHRIYDHNAHVMLVNSNDYSFFGHANIFHFLYNGLVIIAPYQVPAVSGCSLLST